MHPLFILVALCSTVATAAPPPATDLSSAQAAPAVADVSIELDGSVAKAVAFAIVHSPTVRRDHATWISAVHAVGASGVLPDPKFSFAAFVRAVETRVGPQQARLSLSQSLPWPSGLMADRSAAVGRSRVAEALLRASTLEVAGRVQDAYWTLWEVRATRTTHTEHLQLVDGLSESLRARIEVGAATLADLQQVDLSRARLSDAIASMDAQERMAESQLRAALGVSAPFDLATTDAPPAGQVPALDRGVLAETALQHPHLVASRARIDVAQAGVRSARALGLPGFTVGVDYLVTGPATMDGVDDSGKDALMVGVGLRAPLWRGRYNDEVRSAQSRTLATQAGADRLAVDRLAELDLILAVVGDSARRKSIVEETLLPQAEGTYASLLGSYTAGRGTVAQILLSQRDLLDLRVQAEVATADHARAWARLETLLGSRPARTAFGETP
ncbi:MAG: TolC family protein [Myxococcota bacterium]